MHEIVRSHHGICMLKLTACPGRCDHGDTNQAADLLARASLRSKLQDKSIQPRLRALLLRFQLAADPPSTRPHRVTIRFSLAWMMRCSGI
jgi:hypothetical protein